MEAAGRAGARTVSEQLIFQELSSGASKGAGVVLAGGSSKVAFRDAAKTAERYGGEASDWVKKSSEAAHASPTGATYQIHWVENTKTGQIVDMKLSSQATKQP